MQVGKRSRQVCHFIEQRKFFIDNLFDTSTNTLRFKQKGILENSDGIKKSSMVAPGEATRKQNLLSSTQDVPKDQSPRNSSSRCLNTAIDSPGVGDRTKREAPQEDLTAKKALNNIKDMEGFSQTLSERLFMKPLTGDQVRSTQP